MGNWSWSYGSSPWDSPESGIDTISITKLKLIGVGAFGRVWAVTIDKFEGNTNVYKWDHDAQTVYAIKEVNKVMLASKKAIDVSNNEVKLHQLIPKSNFIVNLWYAFQNKSSGFLLMDYAPWGDLLFHMKNLK